MSRYRLRARRQWLGITQREVAAAARVDPVYVSMAETGKRVNLSTTRRIREALAWAEREALHRRNASLRFDRHQRLAASLPDCPEVRALRKAMLDTAWRLLDETRCEEADAILEFLPPDQARALLDEYFYEDDDAPNPTPSPVSEGSVEAREDGSPPTPSEGGPVGVDLREADEGVAPHPDQIR